MADEHEGGCLCGAVRYRVTDEPYLAGVCHCTLCKKRTGSAFGVATYFDESAVLIKSGALKTYEFRSDESNRWLNLEFCSTCGTTVSWTAEFFPGARGISGGTLDDPNSIKPEAQYFTRSAVHWMAFPADVPAFETLPQIDVAAFVAENFPPHVHGENCPECADADRSRLPVCCAQPDLHVLGPANDRVLFLQCLNPSCNKGALVPKKS
jgi:hypothetical protein